MADWHAAISPKGEDVSVTVNDSDTTPSLEFSSRRSPILSLNGSVSSSQPLASSIGLRVLREKGGNAADAAVAMAAALAVTEPCSTGLGGDMFALHYSESSRKVTATNGSGRAPGGLTLDALRADCPGDGAGGISEAAFGESAHVVTVPGAAAGWEDFLSRHGSGRLTFAELLEPAAELAEGGFPVAPITAHHWSLGVDRLIKRWFPEGEEVPLTVDGKRGPRPGEVFRNPDMARVLRSLGSKGAMEGFYNGDAGMAIVSAVKKHGGLMSKEDLSSHRTTFPEPIHAEYRGTKLWQVPPNGQGIAGLIALKGLAALEDRGLVQRVSGPADLCHTKAETMHALIEMMRLGFGDARAFVCDQDLEEGEVSPAKTNSWLLDDVRIGDRAAKIFDPAKSVVQGLPDPVSGTVSFQIVDKDGDAVSFVNSNFMGFGTGIVPMGCGFSLQNRGFGFSLDPAHHNALAPGRRPYHTIIPGIITHADTGELYATISNMGGYMQPQGHLQLTVGLVAAKLDPQAAVDMPRFCIADGTQAGKVFLEDGVREEVLQSLEAMDHKIVSRVSGYGRSVFGKAQIIKRDRETGVLWAGSDGRADGCAMGY